MSHWLHVFGCIAIPCLMGGLMYLGFELWDRRRRRAHPDDGLPPIDYFI